MQIGFGEQPAILDPPLWRYVAHPHVLRLFPYYASQLKFKQRENIPASQHTNLTFCNLIVSWAYDTVKMIEDAGQVAFFFRNHIPKLKILKYQNTPKIAIS